MTNRDMKAALEARGVKVPSKANGTVLRELMAASEPAGAPEEVEDEPTEPIEVDASIKFEEIPEGSNGCFEQDSGRAFDEPDLIRCELYLGSKCKRFLCSPEDLDDVKASVKKQKGKLFTSAVAKAGDRVCITSRGSAHGKVHSIVADSTNGGPEAIVVLDGADGNAGNASNVPLAECAVSQASA